MSTSTTANYHFIMTAVNTEIDAWGPYLNTNWESVDTNIKIVADAAANALAVANSNSPVAHTHNFSVLTGTVATAQIADRAVTNLKLDVMPALSLKGNNTGSAGAPLNLTVADAQLMLGITGGGGGGSGGATTMVENPQTANYALVAGDAGKMVTFNSGSTCACTINSDVFPPDSWVEIIQLGAGVVTFGGTATKRAKGDANQISSRYGQAKIWFVSATEYVVYGDVALVP